MGFDVFSKKEINNPTYIAGVIFFSFKVFDQFIHNSFPVKKIATYKGVVMASDCNAENHMSMTKYVDKFDQAGQRFFLEMGLSPYKTKEIRIVAIEQQTKYLKEAYEEDLIDIYSSLVTIGNKAFTVFHEMFNANSQELISTMTIVFTFFDKNTKRAMPFPKDIKEVLMREVGSGK